jgi:hypothetical protein
MNAAEPPPERRVHHIADQDPDRDGYALCGAELPRDLLGPGHSCDECLRTNRERRSPR